MTDLTSRLSAALAGRYRIDRELGAGGMATVHLAQDLRHDRSVAIKVLRQELAAVIGADRFLQEIKTTAALNHPHILPLFDSGNADGFLFYVMPLVEGETLRKRLDREHQLPVDEAVRIAREVADALEYAHARGVIHRDIKPENILLAGGRPLVADFGIALAASAAAGGRMTETGLSLGTPHYMSPEQATADRDITGRSDVYSLASVLYEMLAGEPPHAGGSPQQVIARIITEEPRPVETRRKSVPPNVAGAVAKGLEKLPADRFATAKEFGDALGNATFVHAVSGAGSAAWGGSGPSSRPTLRAAVPWAIALVAGIAAINAVIGGRARTVDGALRYVLVARETQVSVDGVGSPVAISPDGKTIAFVGANADGVRALWIKDAAALEPRRVEGGAGVRDPFFSPDGASILFLKGGQLWRSSVTGGGAALVGDARTGRTNWTAKGDLLVQSNGNVLVKRPVAGGEWTPILALDTAKGETVQMSPLVLEDGETVLYSSFSIRGAAGGRIGVTTVDGGAATLLDLAGAYPLGVRDGQLIYSTATGAIMAVPFDVAARRVTGVAVALGEQARVEPATGSSYAALSASGDLVFIEGASDRQLAIAAPGAAPRPLDIRPANIRWPRLSPDEKRLAMAMNVDGRTDIWVYDLPSGPMQRITTEGAVNDRPEWTPDGRALLFRSSRGKRFAMWRQAADGSGAAEQWLGKEDRDVNEGVVTRDGRYVVFQSDPNGVADIEYRAMQGDTTAHPIAATRHAELSARFSPDGKWVAYMSLESGAPQVYVSSFPSLATRQQVSLDVGFTPVWSRDGRRLYYASQGALHAAELSTAAAFTVTSRRELLRGAFTFASIHADYDVFSDGRVVGLQPVQGEPRFIVVQGWGEEIRARLATRR